MRIEAGASRAVIIIAVVYTLLVVALSILFFFMEDERYRLAAEYEASRESNRIIETISWADISVLLRDDSRFVGVGLYDAEGNALNRYGDAPLRLENLPPPVQPGTGFPPADIFRPRMELRGQNVIVLRPIPARPMMDMPHDPSMPMPGPPGLDPPGSMGNPRARNRYPSFAGTVRWLFLEYRREGLALRDFMYGFLRVVLPLSIMVPLALFVIYYLRSFRLLHQIEREGRLVQLGQAARTLAHEIKNPLATLALQTATLRLQLPPAQSGQLDIMDQEVARLGVLADRTADYLRDPVGKPEKVTLPDFLQNLQQTMPGVFRYTCQEDDARGPLRVSIDPHCLRSVLENLVINARQSMDAKELVDLTIGTLRSQVKIQVADRGPGIPPPIRDKVFDLFFTTKERGGGIGLALARQYVMAAGGSISFTDRPGGGTIFTVLLPREFY